MRTYITHQRKYIYYIFVKVSLINIFEKSHALAWDFLFWEVVQFG